jgi:DNA-binding response OmpR family regulator
MRKDDDSAPQSAVLIVEDDPGVAAYMADVVETFFQVKVLRAETAEAARDLFRLHAEEIRAVLCDFTLADGAGTTLAKEFCAARADLQILFVTGHLLNEAKLSRVVGREVSLIMKPFGPMELRAAVEKLIWSPVQWNAYECAL